MIEYEGTAAVGRDRPALERKGVLTRHCPVLVTDAMAWRR